tara:strand:+ start:1548 stop:2873 length:1326 start_codon:yes stop_codon:yes gene_type:complete
MSEVFKINGADYECEFILKDDQGEEKTKFTKSAVKLLDLQENLLEPFQNATIVINDPFDFIENEMLTRGDGRDTFTFSLKLKGGGDKLEYDFVLNEEINSPAARDRAGNYKMYSLLDSKYFKLNEIIPYGTRFRGPVGDIIKTILTGVLGDDIVNEEEFEPGDNIVDIFPEHILPPSSFRYSDLIKYLLQIYYFKDEEIVTRSFLKFNRLDKKYSLIPLTKLFKENKDNTIEAFAANDLVDKIKPNKNNPPSEATVNIYETQLPQTNMTTPMLDYSNEFFVNYLATGYDPILGEHVMIEKRIKDIKEKWTKSFVDVFKSVGGKPKPFLPLNNHKKENMFRTISTPFSVLKTANITEAEMTANLVFYNLSLSIGVLGDTDRTSGKFIDVYRTDTPTKSDKKILGRWLVTKCRHKFLGDTYHNTVQCVKTYVGPGTNIKDDID